MPAILLEPATQYNDANGSPLAGGSITFYDTGTTTLKNVYSDPELTTPIANPYVLNSSGRMEVVPYVLDSARYTIVVKDLNDATIYSHNDVWGKSEQDSLSVSAYGAVGDGTTDDTTAIRAAIDDAISQNKTLYIPGGDYIFNGYSIGATASSLAIVGDPLNVPVLRRTQAQADAGGYSIFFSNTRYSTVTGLTLASDITTGERTITFTDGTSLVAGMILHIASDRLWYNGNRGNKYCGEIHKITAVNGNVVTIEDYTRDKYGSGDTLIIRAFSPNKLHLENIRFETPNPATDVTNTGVALQQTDSAVIKNCEFKGFHQSCIQENLCWRTNYERILVDQPDDMRTDDGGYSIGTNGSVGMIVDGLVSIANRRGVDLDSITGTTDAAVTRDAVIRNSTVIGGGAWEGSTTTGVGPHGPAENTTVHDCNFENLTIPILARGRGLEVSDCQASGPMDSFASLHENATGLIVEGCKYESFNYPDKLTAIGDKVSDGGCDQFVRLGLESGDADTVPFFTMPIVIRNNVCKGLNEQFIKIPQNDGTVQFLTVENNTIEFEADSGTVYFIFSTEANTNVSRSHIDFSGIVSDFGASVEMWNSNTVMGYRSEARGWVRVGDNSYISTLPDDQFIRIQQFDAGYDGPCIIALQAGSGVEGLFRINQANATLTDLGGLGADVEGSAVALAGTTGTDAKFTVHLATNGDLYLENRMAAEREVKVTLLA